MKHASVHAEHGATLLELLIACTVLSLLLLLAASVHVDARKVSNTIEEVAYRDQLVELASELLRYHLGLAGHKGVLARGGELGGAALGIDRGGSPGGSDALTVRYLEERWYQSPVRRTLVFDVKRDSNGMWNLYQREEGATRQPAVQEVNTLKLSSFITAEGERLGSDATLPLRAVAVQLELGLTWGETRRLFVELPGPQWIEEVP